LVKIDGVTQKNNDTALESAAAAEQLSQQASHMKDMLSRLTLGSV
jgi:methyl-accepting chemotaxis protein